MKVFEFTRHVDKDHIFTIYAKNKEEAHRIYENMSDDESDREMVYASTLDNVSEILPRFTEEDEINDQEGDR